VAPSVAVRDGMLCTLAGACLVRTCANRGEGGEVVEGPCKCGARVPDGDGHEFHSLPVLLEGRDEGVALIDLLRVFLVASEVSREPNLNENEGAQKCVCRKWCFQGPVCPGLLWHRRSPGLCRGLHRRELMSPPWIVPIGVSGWVPHCIRHHGPLQRVPGEYTCSLERLPCVA
jgi:hypothetical protein